MSPLIAQGTCRGGDGIAKMASQFGRRNGCRAKVGEKISMKPINPDHVVSYNGVAMSLPTDVSSV